MLNRKNIIISLISIYFLYFLSTCISVKSYKNQEETANKYLLMAVKHEQDGLFLQSIKYYRKYISKNYLTKLENAEYIFKIASIYFFHLHDSKKALKYALMLIKHYPLNVYTEEGYVLTAQIYFANHDYYKIIRLLGRYMANVKYHRTKLANMYFFAGKAYFELHKYKLSATYLNLVLTNMKNNKSILYDTNYILSQIYWYQYKDREMAYKYLENLLNLNYKKENYQMIKLLYKKIRWQYITKKQGLKDSCVSAIAFDGDYIWMGLWLGGVVRFTRSSHQLVIYGTKDGLISKYIRDIKIDNNDVWVATFEGISRYNKQTEKWYPYKSIPGVSYQKIKSIAVDKQNVWFGTLSRGIRKYNKLTKKWKSFHKKPKNILKIKRDPFSGKLAFGSLRKGFLIYDKGTWEHYTSKNSILKSKAVKDFAFDKNYIYIAAYKTGVYRYNKQTKKLTHLNLKDNALYINTLKIWKHKLIIGTLGDGVMIYDIPTKTSTNLTIKDGLTSDSIMTIETEKDYIWFGTVNNGVNILYWPDLD